MTMYLVSSAAQANTAQTDLLEIVDAGTGVTIIWGFNFCQTTELGDAAEEIFRLEGIDGFTASGSGGATTVIKPLNPFDTTTGLATVEGLNSTLANTGTTTTTYIDGWNVRGQYNVPILPKEGLIVRNGARYVIRTSAAPTDSITFTAAARVELL